MTFKDTMAADIPAVFHNVGEFAESATLHPEGLEASEPITVTPSDGDESVSAIDLGVESGTTATFLALTTAIAAAMTTLVGDPTRPVRRGDELRFAAGAYLGEWVVQHAVADAGGGTTIMCRRSSLVAPGARGVREVR